MGKCSSAADSAGLKQRAVSGLRVRVRVAVQL